MQCSNLQHNPFLMNVIQKASLVVKLDRTEDRYNKQYLFLQNLQRSNRKQTATISSYNVILRDIANNNIPLINRLLAV